MYDNSFSGRGMIKLIFRGRAKTDEQKNNVSPSSTNQELNNDYEALNDLVKFGHGIAKIGFWSYDIQTSKVFWTEEIYNFLECEPFDLADNLESYLGFVHEEYYSLVKESIEKIPTGEEHEIEYRIKTQGGHEKFLREKTKVVLNGEAKPVKVVGYIQDVTVEKNREAYLNAISDNLAEAQRVSSVGSWKYDVVNEKHFASDEMFNIYGIRRDEFGHDSLDSLKWVNPDDYFKLEVAKKERLEGKSNTVEYRVPQKDGTMKYVVEKAEPVFNESGTIIAIIGTLQDITENKLLEQKLKRSYELLSQAEALAHIGSWECNFATNITTWSEEACRILGVPREGAQNTLDDFKSYVHPEDLHIIDHILKNPTVQPFELEFRIIRADGAIRYIYELVEYVFDKGGNPTQIYGVIQDITERKELQKELESKEKRINNIHRRFNALIKESVDVFEILDKEGKSLYISDAAERITGFKPEERLGKSIFSFYEEDEAAKLEEMLKNVLNNPHKKEIRDIQCITKKGKKVYFEFYMQNFIDDPAIEGIVVNFRDVTNRVRNENRILHISNHDILTGLPNKMHFEKKLQDVLDNANECREIAIFMLDVENTKSIKDSLGYKVVEDFIIQIALKLKLYCGIPIYLCRYSENRFIILMEGEQSLKIYKKKVLGIYELFANPITVRKYELDVEINIGVIIHKKGKNTSDTLIRQAETALFLAKSEGKNKYKFYSSELDIQSYKHFVLRNDLKKSINRNQLRVFFQPLVGLNNDEILCAETLLRWEHPEWGIISPLEFIKMAEETGFIIKVGEWIIKEVCRYYKEWIDKGLSPIKIAINYSSIQLLEAGFVENTVNTIKGFGLDPSFLIMEITENVFIEETDKVIEDIKRLQSYGIQIALDDFGTGYSSLAYLASFNINILKIDGSFIKKINVNETSTTITRYIIKIAQELKIKVVAEHIENWDQLNFLKGEKCYTGQGYIYSAPIPALEFEKLLSMKFLKPTRPKDMPFKEERRKFFRLQFNQLLEALVTVLEINGRKVNVGNTKVLIKNIGPGGLCFISNIRLPIDKGIILRFITELLGEEIRVYGSTVWTKEIGGSLFEYGVEFSNDENKTTELIRVLSRVQIIMRKNIMFAEGSFISCTHNLYFNH